jgi:hypothetical protein
MLLLAEKNGRRTLKMDGRFINLVHRNNEALIKKS